MKPKYISLLGGGVITGGTFLPWLVSGAGVSLGFTGVESIAGIVAAVVGVVVILVSLIVSDNLGRAIKVLFTILGIVVGLMAGLAFVSYSTPDSLLKSSAGAGTYVSFFGALLVVAGGVKRETVRKITEQ